MTKHALVTGATGAIGGAITAAFADAGYSLLLSGRSRASLEQAARELPRRGTHVRVFLADVSRESNVRRLFGYVAREFGSLDVLVAASGIYGEIGTIEQIHAQNWLRAVHTNLFGTVLVVKYALPLLKKSPRGKIICFAGGGDGPLPQFSSYAASKGGIIRFVESVARELSPSGVDINCISPGLVNSGFVRDLIRAGPKRAGKEKYEEARRQIAGAAETVSPERAAQLALFLASRASDGITGKNISAVWDDWKNFSKHKKTIMRSDIYNWRRIKPKDRGCDWK